MKGKAPRKHSLHEKTAVSVLLKPFISGNIHFFTLSWIWRDGLKGKQMQLHVNNYMISHIPTSMNNWSLWLKWLINIKRLHTVNCVHNIHIHVYVYVPHNPYYYIKYWFVFMTLDYFFRGSFEVLRTFNNNFSCKIALYTM